MQTVNAPQTDNSCKILAVAAIAPAVAALLCLSGCGLASSTVARSSAPAATVSDATPQVTHKTSPSPSTTSPHSAGQQVTDIVDPILARRGVTGRGNQTNDVIKLMIAQCKGTKGWGRRGCRRYVGAADRVRGAEALSAHSAPALASVGQTWAVKRTTVGTSAVGTPTARQTIWTARFWPMAYIAGCPSPLRRPHI
jgi:hypothetical protein